MAGRSRIIGVRILCCLINARGFVPKETFKVIVWGITDGVTDNTLAEQVSRLNVKLKPVGFAIIGRREFGYLLLRPNIE